MKNNIISIIAFLLFLVSCKDTPPMKIEPTIGTLDTLITHILDPTLGSFQVFNMKYYDGSIYTWNSTANGSDAVVTKLNTDGEVQYSKSCISCANASINYFDNKTLMLKYYSFGYFDLLIGEKQEFVDTDRYVVAEDWSFIGSDAYCFIGLRIGTRYSKDYGLVKTHMNDLNSRDTILTIKPEGEDMVFYSKPGWVYKTKVNNTEALYYSEKIENESNFADSKKSLVFINPNDGTIIKKIKLYGWHYPLRPDNTLEINNKLIVVEHSSLFCLNLNNLSIEWESNASTEYTHEDRSKPIYLENENAILFKTQSREIVAVDLATGAIKWKYDELCTCSGPFTYHNGKIYYFEEDGIKIIDASIGQVTDHLILQDSKGSSILNETDKTIILPEINRAFFMINKILYVTEIE